MHKLLGDLFDPAPDKDVPLIREVGQLQCGDIVLAAPFRKAPDGHYWRPVVVLRQYAAGIIGAYCTSHCNPDWTDNQFHRLQADKYHMPKDSHLMVDRLYAVGNHQIQGKVGELDQQDLAAIKKKLNRSITAYFSAGGKNYAFQSKEDLQQVEQISVGDIVRFRNSPTEYMISSYKTNQHLFAFRVHHQKKAGKFIAVKTHLGSKWIDQTTGTRLDERDLEKLIVVDWMEESEARSATMAKPKAVSSPAACRFEFPVGKVFNNPIKSDNFIYLFSQGGFSYGTWENDLLEWGQANLISMDDMDRLIPQPHTDTDAAGHIVDILESYRNGVNMPGSSAILEAVRNQIEQQQRQLLLADSRHPAGSL